MERVEGGREGRRLRISEDDFSYNFISFSFIPAEGFFEKD